MHALAVSMLCLLARCPLDSDFKSSDTRSRYEELRANWVAQSEQLAAQCEAAGQGELADSIRDALSPPGHSLENLPVPQFQIASTTAKNPPSRSEAQATWAKLRKQYGRDLFDLAGKAFRAGEVSTSYDLVREVLVCDPDHGQARALLGYTKYQDQWVTPFAAGKLRSGYVWHPRFGWIPKAQVVHHENGEQFWKGQWLPTDEVAKYRSLWANAWQMETDHYLVQTNVSLERGVELATRLEKLYAVFFRLFAGFFSSRDQTALLFDPPGRRSAIGNLHDAERKPQRKFRVNFYRTRQEYLDTLRPHVKSGLDQSTGMYLTGTRTAYFFAQSRSDETIVVHEATHQLFSESREHRHGDGSRGNYWAIEGIACYMETFLDHGDRIELGSWDAARLRRGKQRLQSFMPLERFVQLDMKQFDGPELPMLYCQAACLARFLMHDEGGRFRDAFVKYLEQVYLGKADYETLAELLDTDYATLDRDFHRHVEESRK